MNFLFALILYGHISNQYGRIGIIWNPGSCKIIKVLKHSPAAAAGLHKGDEVLSIDGHEPHRGDIDGDAGTYVTLNIAREEAWTEEKTFVIERVPPSECWDRE